jgi:YcxB-like protein
MLRERNPLGRQDPNYGARNVMKIAGKYLWTDYLDAQLLHMTPRPATRTTFWLLGVALAIFIVAIPIYHIPFESWSACLVPAFILASLYAIYRYVLLPRQVKRIFSQQQELNSPFEMDFSQAGLGFSNEFGQSLRPWPTFHKWKENEKMFVLYHSDIMYTMCPKRLFAGNNYLDAVKHYLSENGVSTASKKASRSWQILIYLLIIIAIGALYYQFLAPNR